MANEASNSITVEIDVPARLRDGTVLRANVYRPAGSGRWPALLMRFPYGKDVLPGIDGFDPIEAARRGYVVIVQDTRGSGTSDGDCAPGQDDNPFMFDAEDGLDTIAWAAGLPYCDGQVGMFGGSYGAYTQLAPAIFQPPALKALVPIATVADPLDGLIFRGGAFELGLAAFWHLMMGSGQLVRHHAQDAQMRQSALDTWASEFDALGGGGYASLPLREFAPLLRQGLSRTFFDWVSAPMDRTKGPSAPVNFLDKSDRLRIPSLHVGCWYDIFLAHTLTYFRAMRANGIPTKLVIGPWVHGRTYNPIGELNFGIGAQSMTMGMRAGLNSLQLRWFDHWLKGRDTGMMTEAPIALFVMGANVWRDELEWPLARAVNTQWYLHQGGVLSRDMPGAETPDSYEYDPADPVPTLGGAILLTPEYTAGPLNQQAIEARDDVLTYTSGAFDRDTEVTGPIAVHLWAVSSTPDTDFVARLTDVTPDGRSINLTDGILRARFRNFSLGETPTLIEPGTAYRYVIDLWATCNVFLAGHRIRLQVTSSCFPRWDRNPNTGHSFGVDADMQVARQQILHDREHPSHVVLPMISAAEQ